MPLVLHADTLSFVHCPRNPQRSPSQRKVPKWMLPKETGVLQQMMFSLSKFLGTTRQWQLLHLWLSSNLQVTWNLVTRVRLEKHDWKNWLVLEGHNARIDVGVYESESVQCGSYREGAAGLQSANLYVYMGQVQSSRHICVYILLLPNLYVTFQIDFTVTWHNDFKIVSRNHVQPTPNNSCPIAVIEEDIGRIY